MLDLIINSIGVLCVVLLVWSLTRGYKRRINIHNQADQIAIEDYLQKITHITGASAYDIFRISAEEWRVSADRIDRDFNRYLSSLTIPYYVKDFVRKGQKHIDELYRGKRSEFADKRLLLFYSFLVLLFWGGALFLSLYVFPHILPENIRMVPGIGRP
ncbi:MAG: hypothetical protein PVG06_18245 [Desulfobacterales bacterium]|jgi:hypothetical protein